MLGTPQTTTQCNRCGAPDQCKPYYHPELKKVVVYPNVCPPCAHELTTGDYDTLDVLRLENTRMTYEKDYEIRE